MRCENPIYHMIEFAAVLLIAHCFGHHSHYVLSSFYRWPRSYKLQQDHPEAVYITSICQLLCHVVFRVQDVYFTLTNVPLTWVLTCPLPASPKSFERPKSATLAFKLSSSKMLLDLTSLCMMGGSASSCKYAKPLAASRQMNGSSTFKYQKIDLPERLSLKVPLGMYS
nr:hypothetical protein PHYPA_001035 [Ipomoea batatas]